MQVLGLMHPEVTCPLPFPFVNEKKKHRFFILFSVYFHYYLNAKHIHNNTNIEFGRKTRTQEGIGLISLTHVHAILTVVIYGKAGSSAIRLSCGERNSKDMRIASREVV